MSGNSESSSVNDIFVKKNVWNCLKIKQFKSSSGLLNFHMPVCNLTLDLRVILYREET